jgi:PERQ amino acid-rich with GYF domain-containing protein
MRKRDGTGTASILLYLIWRNTNIILVDQPALTIPRKLSLSSTQGPLGSPRDSSLPSPRARGPHTPGFDGILNSGDTRVSRRRASESGTKLNSGATPRADGDVEPQASSSLKIDEEEEEHHRRSESTDPLGQGASPQDSSPPLGDSPQEPEPSNVENTVSSPANGNEGSTSPTLHTSAHPVAADGIPVRPSTNSVPVTSSQPLTNPASVEWTYLDPQGQVQGTTSIVPAILRLIRLSF